MAIRITYPAVRSACRRVLVRTGTEYVYRDHHEYCRYTSPVGEDGFGCIVGEIFNELNLKSPLAGTIDSNFARLAKKGVTFTDKAEAFLSRAQLEQDNYARKPTHKEAFLAAIKAAEAV